jgi:lipopolysaccharide transport system ATP-binding protein
MTEIAVKVENLSKLYRIGQFAGYKTIRETLTDVAAAPFRRLRQPSATSQQPNTIWALKDVSFEVKDGDAVGIIGRNGSGKSTLLKILSRITAPTEGRVDIRGRVGSLLEVGTGFHPELTGRENIYLNGAVIGMKRAEVARKFDEIVAFAEIEKFLDTPVKRYSSGMYVRLAFAVAAHLEPEILIVDEVLAVGDTAFQKKCLGKMGEVASEGRTVLFVSHNMAAVQRLCKSALWLLEGRMECLGDVGEVVQSYLRADGSYAMVFSVSYVNDLSKPMQLVTARLHEPINSVFSVSDRLVFELEVLTRTPVDGAYATVNIMDAYDRVAYWTSDIDSARFKNPTTGRVKLICECPSCLLTPGKYSVVFSIVSLGGGTIDHTADKRIFFEVEDSESFLAAHGIRQPGVTAIPSNWLEQQGPV